MDRFLMKRFFCFISVLASLFLNSNEIEILADFYISDLPTQFEEIKKSYKVNTPPTFEYYIDHDPNRKELNKIFLFNPFFREHQLKVIQKLPKEKLILFVFEPYLLNSRYYDLYAKVYTWDDRLIDNVKFFRFNYPYLMPFEKSPIPFEEKKLCSIVTLNWNEYRLDLFRFFEKNYPFALDLYGRPPRNLEKKSMYKGQIPGGPVSKEKIETLKNYRFAICFEHTVGLDGYITEKIFACFAAGCIPIYWGAPNIEKYIPKKCFIDYRDFKSDRELYSFISSMTEKKHQEYITAIQSYLKSKQAQIFSPEYFEEIIYKAIKD